jgi:C4-dicarboxylate transporter DctQ subunit
MAMRALDRLEEIIISILIATATMVIFVAVVQRYSLSNLAPLIGWGKANGMEWVSSLARTLFAFFNSFNLTWAQELCIYMFVWMAKFGAAYGVRTGIHVGVDILLNVLPKGQRYYMILFGLLAGAVFTAIVGSLGAHFVWHMAHTDQTSPDLEMPMWIVYLAVPLGSYLMCFRFLQVAWSFAQTGELPVHDHGHVDGMDEETEGVDIADKALATEPNLHPKDLSKDKTSDRTGGKP